MEVSPDDFRRLYDRLSDHGLRSIKRDDLTDIARQCYDQELASRGLTLDPTGANESELGDLEGCGCDEDEPKNRPEEMVELATFTSYEDSKLARAMLKSAEIPSYLEDLRSSLGATMRLFVPSGFLDQAREVLDSELSDEELARQAEAELPPDDAERY